MTLPIRITFWDDVFNTDITGHIHRVDPFTQLLRIKVKSGVYEQIVFEDVIGVAILEKDIRFK
ncbi:YolD-like family protein [Bacillus sp. X1(2014)]|uniref:YolD-like family protein n=1 Tax=Bacillus sp. X1(2014) TaxID=1565991 RepID=UPI0011A2F74D